MEKGEENFPFKPKSNLYYHDNWKNILFNSSWRKKLILTLFEIPICKTFLIEKTPHFIVSKRSQQMWQPKLKCEPHNPLRLSFKDTRALKHIYDS